MPYAAALMDRVDAIARLCDAEGHFDTDEVLMSAGGSAIFDLVAARLHPRLGRPVRGLLHSGQHAIETTMRDSTYGAFSYHFVDALRDAGADVDRDGRISLLEAAVAAARRLLDMGAGHLPALAGEVESTALFEAERRPGAQRPQGRLHAVLVGMERFSWGNLLAGPPNDLARWSKLLGSLERSVRGAAQVYTLLNEQATPESAPNQIGR